MIETTKYKIGDKVRSLAGYKTKEATGTVINVTRDYLGIADYLWIELDSPVMLSTGPLKKIGRSPIEVALV